MRDNLLVWFVAGFAAAGWLVALDARQRVALYRRQRRERREARRVMADAKLFEPMSLRLN